MSRSEFLTSPLYVSSSLIVSCEVMSPLDMGVCFFAVPKKGLTECQTNFRTCANPHFGWTFPLELALGSAQKMTRTMNRTRKGAFGSCLGVCLVLDQKMGGIGWSSFYMCSAEHPHPPSLIACLYILHWRTQNTPFQSPCYGVTVDAIKASTRSSD
jgi:hypothetical protein